MKTSRILIPALLGLVAACGFKPAKPRDAYERVATTFPHEKHGGFDCTDCHTGIIKSVRLGDSIVMCGDADSGQETMTENGETPFTLTLTYNPARGGGR